MAVLKKDSVSSLQLDDWHVFESVFRRVARDHNYCPGSRTFTVRVGSRTHDLPGWLYCQQNGLNKACAQVAIRGLLEGGRVPVLPYSRINEIARTIRDFRPADGLQTDQVEAIMHDLGISYTRDVYGTWAQDPKAAASDTSSPHPDSYPFQKLIYAGVEAGEGAFFAFELQGPNGKGRHHGIPIIGHTFNADTWVSYADNDYFHLGSETQYLSSDTWLSTFVTNDDNFGSNLCIPKHYVTDAQARYVLSIHREGFEDCCARAEVAAIDYLRALLPKISALIKTGNSFWLQHLVTQSDKSKIVLRAVPLTRTEFCDHLCAMRDWDGLHEHPPITSIFREFLPTHVWMVEISVPELFPSNKRKLGCIVLDGSRHLGANLDFSSFLFARVPGHYLFLKPIDSDHDPDFESLPSDVKSHVSVFCRQLPGFQCSS